MKYFANHMKGELIKDILETNDFPKRSIPLKESIYKYWSITDGVLLTLKGSGDSSVALSPMIQMGPQLTGVDKLEHMFGMGFKYFNRHYLKGVELEDILERGQFMEKTTLGGNIFETGVYSYADLSANFNGMRFWNHMLQKRDDVLGPGMNIGPYIKCNEGKWEIVQNNPIDFRNYIDISMDESINCSVMATKSGTKKFQKAMKELSPNYTCPMDQAKLQAIKEKYNVIMSSDDQTTISEMIFNPNN